jgi:hypothetical protein
MNNVDVLICPTDYSSKVRVRDWVGVRVQINVLYVSLTLSMNNVDVLIHHTDYSSRVRVRD